MQSPFNLWSSSYVLCLWKLPPAMHLSKLGTQKSCLRNFLHTRHIQFITKCLTLCTQNLSLISLLLISSTSISSKLSSSVTWITKMVSHLVYPIPTSASIQSLIQLQPEYYIQNMNLFSSSPCLKYLHSFSSLWGKAKALSTRVIFWSLLTSQIIIFTILSLFAPTTLLSSLSFIFRVLPFAPQGLCKNQFPYKK